MDQASRLNLSKMIKEYGSEETTDKIRDLKHSSLIRQDVTKMLELKKKYNRLDTKTLNGIIQNQCFFLYKNYTHIYNKILKDRVDMSLFDMFLNILEQIENGEIDQHDGSYKVGQILKKIYIDSAIKENEQNELKFKKKKKTFKKSKNISWSEYKKMSQ